MPTTITLPEYLEAQLRQAADAQERSVEEVALALLRDAAAALPPAQTLESVVAKIKAAPPAPGSVRPAQGSLREALQALVQQDAEDQDARHWDAEWADVETELRAMTHADDLREGRGF